VLSFLFLGRMRIVAVLLFPLKEYHDGK
jgi:hypothetical protein